MIGQGTDPGSFRDPSGFVYHRGGRVLRQVNAVYREEYDALLSSGLYRELVDDGLLVPHRELTPDASATPDCYKLLEPERVAFISYPCEWCCSQLCDAALATLAIQKRALARGMTLKDASAYNIQFLGGKPVHIDGIPLDLASRLLPGRTRFSVPLEAVDTIVTDAIGAEDRARLEENGVDVLAAGQDGEDRTRSLTGCLSPRDSDGGGRCRGLLLRQPFATSHSASPGAG